MCLDRLLNSCAVRTALLATVLLGANACADAERSDTSDSAVTTASDVDASAPSPSNDAAPAPVQDPSSPPSTVDAAAADARSQTDSASGADAGSAAPDASPTPDASQPDAAQSEPCVRGQTKAERVLMIGDSFYDFTEVPERLWDNARSAGSLGPSETYPHFYKNGALMTEIVAQYDTARSEGVRADYVIMNGGGNEVLIADRSCLTEAPPKNAQCTETIDKALTAAKQLFTRLKADGVKAVIFANYPHMPEFGLFQGSAPAINQTGDYAEALSRKSCEEAPLPCHFVSTIAAFEGHPEYLNFADVHASPAGSKVIADLIWATMQQHCIAQ
jgi:lysophospholipase L1-like esterase